MSAQCEHVGKVNLGVRLSSDATTGLVRRPDGVFQGRQSRTISMAAEKPGHQKAPDSSGQ